MDELKNKENCIKFMELIPESGLEELFDTMVIIHQFHTERDFDKLKQKNNFDSIGPVQDYITRYNGDAWMKKHFNMEKNNGEVSK